MSLIGVHTDLESGHKRWIAGALGLALLLHVIVAGALGWYKIPGLEIPSKYSQQTGPFVVKQIEINPDALKAPQEDPTAKLPVADPPANPSQFNLDTTAVEKALQTPQPSLTAPSVPEPNKVIAASDLNQGLPLVESNTATMTAEIARVDPATTGGPETSSKFAQELINSTAGPNQPGTAPGATPTGDGTAAGKLPGFATLAPTFKSVDPNLSKLPEPVLLRLPSDVLFDFDSATLKPEAAPLLTQAVGLITKYPQADVTIDGYSDSIGKPDYNLTLSQQRAEAVEAWLQQHTMQAGYKYRSQGHGSTNYVVSAQGSIEQQQPNRRVEILIQALKL